MKIRGDNYTEAQCSWNGINRTKDEAWKKVTRAIQKYKPQ